MAFHRIRVLAAKQMPNASWTLVEHISSGCIFIVSRSFIVEETAVFNAVAYTRPLSRDVYDFDMATAFELYKTEKDVDTVLAKLDNGDIQIKVTGRKLVCT